jgi:two-component system, NtrC family, sensor kinase
VDLPQLIEQTLLINANLLKIAGVVVERRLDSDRPGVVGSEDQLQQVFMNLFSNAAEAMEGHPRRDPAHREPRHEPGGGAVVVRVADTGSGDPGGERAAAVRALLHHQEEGPGALGWGCRWLYGIIQEHGGIDQRPTRWSGRGPRSPSACRRSAGADHPPSAGHGGRP